MSSIDAEKTNQLGYITILGSVRQGFVGGFLVLNRVGRPTEFHCTAPVRANRAQEILYGASLETFLCGDQIAQTLIDRSKSDLIAIITDVPAVLSIQDSLNVPLVYFFRPKRDDSFHLGRKTTASKSTESFLGKDSAFGEPSGKSGESDERDSNLAARRIETEDESERLNDDERTAIPGLDWNFWKETTKNRFRLAVPDENRFQRFPFAELSERLDLFFKSIDVPEPFERIRLAIEEAQRSSV